VPARGQLDPAYRAAAVARLGDSPVDVLVIGGGVTGAGVALDAALRGLKVVLVEQRDFAAGTSSRSSKLVHGGLRYLEKLDFRLVREALRERTLLLETLAPHLVHPLPFLYPLSHRVWERPYVGAGLTLYDSMAGLDPSVPRHRHLSKRAALEAFPDFRSEAITGAIRYYDAQVDDARHTLELVRTAAAYGATVLSGMRVTSMARDGDRIVGATLIDAADGAAHEVTARVVINATGPWAGRLESLAGVENPVSVRTSKGVHLVVPRDRINASLALISRTPTSVLFVLPWGSCWLLGTTDTAWQHGLSHPVANSTDVAYILEQANRVLRSGLELADVIGVYAGLRPLVDVEGLSESEISREHVVRRPIPGFVTICGGKYTTYRIMAADTVDACVPDLGPLPDSASAEVPMLGAAQPAAIAAVTRSHPGAAIVGESVLERLRARYGMLTTELLDLIVDNPSLAAEIPGGAGHIGAEVTHSVTYEAAVRVDDVLTRRTRLYLEAGDRGLAAAPHVAELMGQALGWDAAMVAAEVDRYSRRVAAELEAQSEPDDAGAAAARERIVDPRLPSV